MTRFFLAVKRSLFLSLLVIPVLASAGPLLDEPLSLGGGAPAPTKPARATNSMGAPLNGMEYGGLIALEVPPSGFDIGPRISAHGMYGFMTLSPEAQIDLGGRVSFAYHGGNALSVWVFDVVPDARIKYSVSDQLTLYGDVGLGLGIMDVSTNSVTTLGTTIGGSSDTSLVLTIQFGGGVSYAITPMLNLVGEVRFNIYTKSGSSTFVSIPGVGLVWHG
jgi:opacity protein-like surface antigen